MGGIAKETRSDRRRASFRAGLALLVLVVSGPVWGDPAFDAGALRGLLEARGFSETQTQAALGMLERANARGLPAAALVHRVREGMARRAEPSAILDVLSGRLSNLERADDMARRCAREGITVRDREHSLLRLADSFSMGVTPGDVGSVLPAAAMASRDLETVSRTAEVMGRARRLGVAREKTSQLLAQGILEKKEPAALVAAMKESSSTPPSTRSSGSGAAKGGRGAGGSRGPASGPKSPGPRGPRPQSHPHHRTTQ